MNALRSGFLGAIGVLVAIGLLYLFVGSGAVIAGFGTATNIPTPVIALALVGLAITALGVVFWIAGDRH